MTEKVSKAEVQQEEVRSPTGKAAVGQSCQEAAGACGPLKAGGRWSPGRKKGVVLRLLRGEPIDAVSREIGVQIFTLEQWRKEGLAGLEAALKRRTSAPEQIQLDEAMKRVGELTMEVELLRKRIGGKPGPLARRRS
jgi:transposase-like protein